MNNARITLTITYPRDFSLCPQTKANLNLVQQSILQLIKNNWGWGDTKVEVTKFERECTCWNEVHVKD